MLFEEEKGGPLVLLSTIGSHSLMSERISCPSKPPDAMIVGLSAVFAPVAEIVGARIHVRDWIADWWAGK